MDQVEDTYVSMAGFEDDYGRNMEFTIEARYKNQMAKILEADPSFKTEASILEIYAGRFSHLSFMNPFMMLLSIRILVAKNGKMPSPEEFNKFAETANLEKKVHPDFLRYLRLMQSVVDVKDLK